MSDPSEHQQLDHPRSVVTISAVNTLNHSSGKKDSASSSVHQVQILTPSCVRSLCPQASQGVQLLQLLADVPVRRPGESASAHLVT